MSDKEQEVPQNENERQFLESVHEFFEAKRAEGYTDEQIKEQIRALTPLTARSTFKVVK